MGEHCWEKNTWFWKFLQKNSSSSQTRESFNKSVFCFHYLGICLKHTTRDHFPIARSGHVGNRTAFIVTPPPIQKTLWVTGKEAQSDFSTSQIPAHIFSPSSCISGTFAEETRVIKEWLVIKLTALLVRQGKLPQDLQSPCCTNWCMDYCNKVPLKSRNVSGKRLDFLLWALFGLFFFFLTLV